MWRMVRRGAERWEQVGRKMGTGHQNLSCSSGVPSPGAALASPTAALQTGLEKDEASAPCKRNFLQSKGCHSLPVAVPLLSLDHSLQEREHPLTLPRAIPSAASTGMKPGSSAVAPGSICGGGKSHFRSRQGLVCFSSTPEGEGSIAPGCAGSMGGFGGWGTLGSLLLWEPNLINLEAKLVEKSQSKEFTPRDVEKQHQNNSKH